MLLLLLLKLERRRRQLPSPQLPGSYLAAAAAIINVTWRLSIVNLGVALEFEWVDQGMMQVGLFFKVLFYVLSYATSCGGTQSVMVLMSTTSWLSTHGRLKWRPEGVAAGAKQKDN